MEQIISKDARYWQIQLDLAAKQDERWLERSKKIVKRYRDEHARPRAGKRYAMLWANVQTMLPVLYSRTPKAEAERRNKDNDPISRTAAEMIQRALQYEIDVYPDFDAAMRSAVQDMLLPGRGVAWVRFESETVELAGTAEEVEAEEATDKTIEDQPEAPEQEIVKPRTVVDYVYWEDFRHSPARCWAEVDWIARRVYMTQAEAIGRFGEDVGKSIPLVTQPIGLDDMKSMGLTDGDMDSLKKAEIWEIWCKSKKQVIWFSKGAPGLLEEKDDYLGLDGFFPVPEPLYATQTNDTLTPVPDFVEYQDQADEIDMLTARIGYLTDALKVRGIYPSFLGAAVGRIFTEGQDNTLVPVEEFEKFSELGGLAKGAIQFVPLGEIVAALRQCYESREQAKQVVFEITGISDIIRGATRASETATAQNIKRQFGSLRVSNRQKAVARFASEILRIKAQMMADLFPPEDLVAMSGMDSTPDAQHLEPAIELLRAEPTRQYRIEVASDSLVEMDEEQEKASRTEFLQAASQFMNQALPMAQAVPELQPLLGEMLMFGVRAFPAARTLEATFEQAMEQLQQPKPEQPDPAQMQAQQEAQMEQMKLQMDQQAQQARMQADMQIQQAKMQMQAALEQQRSTMQAQVDRERAQSQAEVDRYKADLQDQSKTQEAMMKMEFERWKVELQEATKIKIASMTSQTNDPAVQAADGEIQREIQP